MNSHVLQKFNRLASIASEGFTLDRLRGEIECYRNKPLLIEFDTMPVGITAYVIGLQDVDLICTGVSLDPVLTLMGRFHECAHLLLDHIPLLSAGDTTPTYQQFIKTRDLQQAKCRSLAAAYVSPEEDDAEMLATLLLELFVNSQCSMPKTMCAMYGL